jgi:protein ImuB
MVQERLYLALWFPFLSTDRARRLMKRPRGAGPDEVPFVLVETRGGALRIAALDRVAAGSRLSIGMALAQARSWLPAIEVGEADPQADRALLLRLAAACERFTPLVALRGTDGLMLDIAGCAQLFGGESELGARACRQMIGMGVGVRAAIAGTPDAAWAFARFTKGGIVPPGEAERLARGLAVEALEAGPETTLALARAGLKTLGDLADRPSHLIASRFGGELPRVLARILGRENIRITPLRPPPEIVADRHFPEPLAHLDSLMAALERLAGEVCERLGQRGEGGRAFEACFFRSDGLVRRIGIETARPTRDPQALMRLMRLRIEVLADPLDPGFGFDAVRLALLRGEPMVQSQPALDGSDTTASEAEEVAALVERLVARFGRESVLRFVVRDTHDPMRAGGTMPYLADVPAPAPPVSEPGQPPARPLTLFEHPQPIEVLAEVPDSPPLRFRWRRVLHEVARAEGPERIAPEWWRQDMAAASGGGLPATRDYYRVEDAEGRRFWIFREGLYEDAGARPRWFLHGLFA